MGNGEIDYDKVTEIIIREIRTEKIGPLSFERPRNNESGIKIYSNQSFISMILIFFNMAIDDRYE